MMISTIRSAFVGKSFYPNFGLTFARNVRWMSSRNNHSFPVGAPGNDIIGPESPHHSLFLDSLSRFNQKNPDFLDKNWLQSVKSEDSVVLRDLLNEVSKLNKNFERYFGETHQTSESRVNFMKLSPHRD